MKCLLIRWMFRLYLIRQHHRSGKSDEGKQVESGLLVFSFPDADLSSAFHVTAEGRIAIFLSTRLAADLLSLSVSFTGEALRQDSKAALCLI